MKFKQTLVLAVVGAIGVLNCVGQEIKSKEGDSNKQIMISTGMYTTSFRSGNVSGDVYKTVDKNNGISLGMSYQKKIGGSFSVSLGINYATYSQTVYQKGTFERKNQVDRDNYSYDLLLIAEITEEYSVGVLEVPLMLKFMTRDQKTFYGFAEVGVVFGLNAFKSYEKKGTLENQGKYQTDSRFFDVISHDNSYYGHQEIGFKDGKRNIYSLSSLSGRIAIGISAVTSENLTLSIAPTYTFGLTDIYNKEIKEEDYHNIFDETEGYKPTKLSSFGFSIGLLFAI